MPRDPLGDFYRSIDSDDALSIGMQVGQELVNLVGKMLPGITDKQRLIEIVDEYGDCAFFLDEISIAEMSKPKIVEKSRMMLSSGQLIQRSFSGDEIAGVVADGARVYHPSFSFDLADEGCDCSEPPSSLCSHIVALMLAWVNDKFSFLPINPSKETQAVIMRSFFGDMAFDVTGERDYTRAMAMLQLPHAAQPVSKLMTTSQTEAALGISGKADWPTARANRMAPPPLKQTVEAEFNTAQLRELAKGFGIKLKGTAKSAYVDQVATEIATRAARMRQTPDLLLEGLTDDQANLVRRAMTARDYNLPLPRNLANNLWSQLTNREPDKRVTDALDALRRKAILFPTRNYVGSRDVYYQWLPLDASGGNVPLMKWSGRPILAKNKPEQPAPGNQANFLDAFEMLISALMSSGAEIRASLPRHAKTDSVQWLQHWEHNADEADRLLNSRPGWVPNPSSGVGVPLIPSLTPESRIMLEGLTGLTGAQCEFQIGVASALQLIEAPDVYAGGPFKLLKTPVKVGARTSAIEEWFALTDEAKLTRTWTAWRQQMFLAFEATRAAHFGRKPAESQRFNVMRAIGAREFSPADLAAEWASLRRYVTRVLCGLPRNEWIGWPELRKQLFEFFPDCQWTLFGQEHWWFNAPGKPTRLDINRYDDWQLTVGSVIENIIAEPLRWFGVVETVAGANGLETFRVTGLLDWLSEAQAVAVISSAEGGDLASLPRLPASAQPRPRQIEPVKWLDDSRWHLPPAPDRAEFISFARLIADATDAPFTYALTPTSIERAITAGIGLDEVTRHFDQIGAPMPITARELYGSIAERFGRVRLYESLSILQLADDYALRELMSATSLGQHVVYTISPRAVVVKAEAIDGLVEEFIAKGYTPGVK